MHCVRSVHQPHRGENSSQGTLLLLVSHLLLVSPPSISRHLATLSSNFATCIPYSVPSVFYTPSNACACAVSRARIRRLQPWARPAKTKARALTSIFLINYLPRSQTAGSWLYVLPRI